MPDPTPIRARELSPSARAALAEAARLAAEGFRGTVILEYGGDGGIGTVETRQVRRTKELRDAA